MDINIGVRKALLAMHMHKKDITQISQLVEIRDAVHADIEKLLNAQNITFPDDPSNFLQHDFELALKDRRYSIIVAEYKGEFAGYTISHDKQFRPWTSANNLIVLKEYFGNSIGSRLLNELIARSNRPYCRLFVEKKNRKAISLYKKYGFFKMGSRKDHYEDGDDALIMLMYIWGKQKITAL